MTSSNNPRFRLLVGWCCLMTSALLILSVYLATKRQKTDESNAVNNETNVTANQQINTKPDQLKDNEKTWILDSDERSFLSLNNGTVEIKTAGLYHIHAQVTFNKVLQKTKNPASVILLKNKCNDTQDRKLSEVMGFEPGTLTLIRLVKLKKGESISLKIKPELMRLSNEADHTYWEILLYMFF